MAWKLKGSPRLVTVTDAIFALGMPPGKYKLTDFEITVDEEKVTIADGTLAGSIVTQQESLRNLKKWTECSLKDAVCTLTATPAVLLSLPNKGRIALGLDADFVLIHKNINIKATIVGGKILFKDF